MDRLWSIAPPTTWALLAIASSCLLAGFTLLSHSLLRRKALGDEWRGWTTPGGLGWTLRWGLALLAGGGLLWALTLDAALAWPVVLGVIAAGMIALDLRAKHRGSAAAKAGGAS